MKAEMRTISLFSGCGGLDLGFRGRFESLGKSYKRLPFDVVWANDIDSSACDTYSRNIGNEIHCGDIWSAMDTLPTHADIVLGGFPCQDVSINGLGKGSKGERTNLYKAMLEVVRRVQPRAFIAENVKGLMQNKHENYRAEIINGFENLGYNVNCHLYLAANYGVPQMRERVFIVGIKGKEFIPPKPLLAKSEWVTAESAVKDLEMFSESPEINHVWSKAKPNTEQGNRTLKADRPASTVRAECHGNNPFHYRQPRRVSMRETARFQSFPDDFTFACGIRQIERQIGNAVPPVLAWHVAKAVMNTLS